MRKLTDREYVDSIKKIEQKRARAVLMMLTAAILILALSGYYGYELYTQLETMAADLEANARSGIEMPQPGGNARYLLGAVVGFVVSGGVFAGVALIGLALQHGLNARKDRLLIACHERQRQTAPKSAGRTR